MKTEQEYETNQEYNEFQRLINTCEYLTKAEKEFCEKWDKEECDRVLNYIGDYSKFGDYLNINVYSEHDHEKKQFEYETGI